MHINKNCSILYDINNTKALNSIEINRGFKERLSQFRKQTLENNELNAKARNALRDLIGFENVNEPAKPKALVSKKETTKNKNNSTVRDYTELAIQLLTSKTKRTLRSYVKYRRDYMQHTNYWQQIWLFTDNPIYEYGNNKL